jgi:alkanesulfonate monooxygenase SsuD/methylene tetrahydromethanopterin reductase-like flavin-dependent oxidoreductase (luciferase family)
VLPPGDRAARLEEFVEVLDRVLTGDHLDHAGRFYTVVDARTTIPCLQRPRLPFVVAANGPRTLRLAARYGEGWATTGAITRGAREDAWWEGVGALAERLTETLADVGREQADMRRMLSLDAAGTFSLTSAAYFEEAVGRAGQLGFTDVVVHWPVPGAPVYDAPESRVEEIAALLPSLRGADGS